MVHGVTYQIINAVFLAYHVFIFVIYSPVQWVPEVIIPGVERPGREADHSHLSSSKVKNAWSYTSTPPRDTSSWFGT